mmetsp:Transcript_8236/g.21018  ORF Transcript_8236/g.21018 Transcript_8236/m.21018 type:complete len:155 (+) Transcript_8236:246-710(+)
MEPSQSAARRSIADSFREFDDGSKGWLTRNDLKCAVACLVGYKPSKVELGEILRAVPEGSVLDEAAFTACMEWRLGIQDPDERIRQIFKSFDYRCSGFISSDDLLKVFTNCVPHIPHETARQVFDEIDSDRDGRVSLREFVSIMKFGRVQSWRN